MTATQPAARCKWRTALRQAWSAERDCARVARANGDSATEWQHLERAHILSHPDDLRELLALEDPR
jgi:hypothetical protein